MEVSEYKIIGKGSKDPKDVILEDAMSDIRLQGEGLTLNMARIVKETEQKLKVLTEAYEAIPTSLAELLKVSMHGIWCTELQIRPGELPLRSLSVRDNTGRYWSIVEERQNKSILDPGETATLVSFMILKKGN